ncbi:MAG: methyltransferase domain-containing protein [Thaumarchaeota archaeon]|nr:methyltransferase domain-containing protein [Nitrososphaerota archaeon]
MERQFALWMGRRLPIFLRRPLASAYSYFNGLQGKIVIWNSALIETLSQFYEMNSADVKKMLRNASKLIEETWEQSRPKSEEEEVELYKKISYYPLQLAYWHMSLQQRRFRNWVIKQCKGAVLDYGGGIGDLSLALWRRGHKVTYLDIRGSQNERFAKFLFEKHGADIEMIPLDDKSQMPELGTYDTIVCLDVIEHVPDAKQTIRTFHKHLVENGKLIATNIYYNPESRTGDHRATGLTRAFMKETGFREINGFMWIRERDA